METTNSSDDTVTPAETPMEIPVKQANPDEEFFEDTTTHTQDFENPPDNEDGYEQRFQGANRGGFR